MKNYHQLEIDAIFTSLRTSETGLTAAVVPERRQESGENILKEAPQKSRWAILLAQFADIMIVILTGAAIVSFAVGEHTDALVIIAIIAGNAWLGFSQESKAEASIQSLKKMTAPYATVLRDNLPAKIEARHLVPGDVILLEAGDIVPADARLIELSALKTDEASLTGESHAIEKQLEPVTAAAPVPGDQLNMVFKGTIVSNGAGKAVVTAIGMQTELGKIAGLLEEDTAKTPLQQRLAAFSKQLAIIVIIICLLVLGFGIWRGEPPFQMFLTALSLAVAALPEALPAVITIALAQGAGRMARQNALIRKLPAVETLGSVTYICSDKTGTLTQNVMTVEKFQAAAGQEELLEAAMMLNNEVRFADQGELLGDSTETALIRYVLEKDKSREATEQQFPLVEKYPFDSERMRMSTLHRHGDQWILFTKGAPGKMVETLSSNHRDKTADWLETNREWAAEGLRVLFFAYRIFDREPQAPDLEKDLDFLGMTALIDPPREEVIDAIRQCKTAGIHPVMITGDQPLTANAIARRLLIVEEDSDNVQTGADLDKLDEAAFIRQVRDVSVYARVSPEQKLRIVKALQTNNEFVAMTGDGVNDAPSLRQADIGIAMGITGTDVSKEAADMILLDDNFTTIIKAVREGRRIYENIRKFILYVLSCNLSEILTIFLAPLFGFVIPLLPIHILWINLVTDGLPGIALVAEPAEKDLMNHPPRPPKENLFAGGLAWRIVASGFVMTVASLLVLNRAAGAGYDVITQQTMVFTTLCFVQLGNVLSVRSVSHSLFAADILANKGLWGAIVLTLALQLLLVYTPFLQPIFKTASIPSEGMFFIVSVTAGSILALELLKLGYRRFYFRRTKVS